MTTLCLAEHAAGALSGATACAVTAAVALGQPVHLLVLGKDAEQAANQARRLGGIEKVLFSDADPFAYMGPETTSATLLDLAGGYAAFVAPSTATWKSILPRFAALLDVMYVSDVIEVLSPDTFERAIYAGNAIQKVRSSDAKKVLTIRATAFEPSPPAAGDAPVERGTFAITNDTRAHVTGESLVASDRPELGSARIVVSGGRGLQSAENFASRIEPLADRLGAAIGASRAAVDSGYTTNDRQVGQTGKVVAPELYIAVGISGAIQHLAGMKDSKVIVAINKDPDAPIHQVADYQLIEDLNVALPQIEAALAE